MHRVVVVQWSRLGDLLQTRPLLEHIARSRPGCEITLCADQRYAEVVTRLRQPVNFWPVELSRLSAEASHADSHGELLRTLAETLERNVYSRTDEVYVLSRSFAAVMFVELLSPSTVHGYRRDGKQLVVPQSVRLLEQAEMENSIVPVEIADVWANLDGVEHVPAFPTSLLCSQNEDSRERTIRRVGLICDAGQVYRTIPQPWLRQLVQLLSSESVDANVTLFGMRPDSGHAITTGDTITDLRGRTSLAELCNLLAAQDVVIGADTGGLHLAAALDVPVIGLYFGGASCLSTGPYAQRAVVLQDPLWDEATAERVAMIAQHLSVGQFPEANILGEMFRPSLDEHGLVYMSSSWSEEVRSDIAATRRKFVRQTRVMGASCFA